MKIQDIEITDIQRVTLRPGDLLAVKCNTRLTRQQCDDLRAYYERQVPDHDILILDAGMSLAIVGEE